MPKPPPVPFPTVPRISFRAGEILHRNHAHRYAATAFNPGLGAQATRFSPFRSSTNAVVPTLYAATSREAAAFETIFHDVEPSALFKTVPLLDILVRDASEIRPRRDLAVVPLFTPELNAWGIQRTDLVETEKSMYFETVLWAEAIHHAAPDIDGLIWTSRRCDPDRCLVLFGDRVVEEDFDVLSTSSFSDDADLLIELRRSGRRAGIEIVD